MNGVKNKHILPFSPQGSFLQQYVIGLAERFAKFRRLKTAASINCQPI